jgi:hypothetical protein
MIFELLFCSAECCKCGNGSKTVSIETKVRNMEKHKKAMS